MGDNRPNAVVDCLDVFLTLFSEFKCYSTSSLVQLLIGSQAFDHLAFRQPLIEERVNTLTGLLTCLGFPEQFGPVEGLLADLVVDRLIVAEAGLQVFQ